MKETCIYKELERSVPRNASFKEVFSNCVSFFNERYGIKLFFCEVKGNRWSYVEGNSDLVTDYSKFRISGDMGVFIQNSDPDIACEIASSLKQFFS